MISNLFKRFYDKRIDIVAVTAGGGYSRERKETLLETVYADVQPYGGKLILQSGGIQRTEYGLKSSSTLKVFCDSDFIKVGNFVRYNDKLYRITCTDQRQFGKEALLDEYIG